MFISPLNISPLAKKESSIFSGLCSFLFDNSTKHLSVANADLKDICTGSNKSFSFGVSCKPTATGSAGSLFSDHHVLASKRIDIGFNASDGFFILQYNAGIKLLRAQNVASTNWINAMVVVDGNTPSNNKIYVNGVSYPLQNNSLNGSTATSTTDFHIGNDGNSPVAPFGGHINQEFFIDRVVTFEEYTNWYNYGNIKSPYNVWGSACAWFFNPKNSIWDGSNYVNTDPISGIISTSSNMLEIDKDCSVNPYSGIQNKFDNNFIQSVLKSEEDNYNVRSAASIFKFNYSGTYLGLKANPTMYGTFPDDCEIIVKVDGVNHTVQQIVDSTTLYEITLPSGDKVVELIESGQTDIPPPSTPVLGTFLTEILVTGEDFNKINPSAVSESITFLGDSITIGGNSSIWSDNGYAVMFRSIQEIPTTILGHGYGTLADFAATTPLIDETISQIVESFQNTSTTKKMVISLGTNDFGVNALASATFKTYYENLVDAINSEDSDIEIFCISPLIRSVDGALLDAYRTAIDDLCGVRSFCTHIAGKTILTTGAPDFDDLIHPSDSGHIKYNTAVAAIVTP